MLACIAGGRQYKSKQLALLLSGIVLTSPKELNFICYWSLQLQKNVFFTGGDFLCSKLNYHPLHSKIMGRKK